MIIRPSSAGSMTFSLRAINERAHYNRISLDLILRRPPSWRGRLEGWPRVIAVHPSFETPCCARLLRMRSDFSRAKSWRRNNANDTEKVKKRIAASGGVSREENMKRLLIAAAASMLAGAFAFGQSANQAVVRLDPAFDALASSDAKGELVKVGFGLTAGPLR